MLLEISQNSQENTRARVLFLNKVAGACNFVKKETLVQVFPCEFCEISKNTFFTEHLWVTASGILKDFMNEKNELLFGDNITLKKKYNRTLRKKITQ